MWIVAEAKLAKSSDEHEILKMRYARFAVENRAMRSVLPEPHRGRTSQPIRYEAWPATSQRRLVRHLGLVDPEGSA